MVLINTKITDGMKNGPGRSLIGPDGLAGIYWRGDNGKIYTQDNFGRVIEQGGGTGVLAGGNQSFGGLTYREVGGGSSAPDPTKNTNNTNNTGDPYGLSGGGGGGSSFVDTSAARNMTQAQLGSLDRQLANLNQSAQDEYDALMDQYRAENAENLENYQGQVAKNESTRSGGISQSLAAAAQGGRGLRSALAAMGALGGTGSVLANRAVASSANKDVGGVNETFDTNATGLNSAWKKTEREQRQRDEDAKTGLKNARVKNRGTIAGERQGLFKDMAGFWEQAGNKSEAANWLAKMSTQNPFIEQAARTATPNFQRASASFSPAALKNYLAGNQDMSVKAETGDSGLTLNSPLYASRTRREEYA